MLRDDVIIWTAIALWPIVKGEFDLHLGLPPCLEPNSLSGYCKVSSRSIAMLFYDSTNFSRGFPGKHSNASHTRKSYSGRSRAHLAVSTQRVWFQTRGGALGVNRVRLLLWATKAARMIQTSSESHYIHPSRLFSRNAHVDI